MASEHGGASGSARIVATDQGTPERSIEPCRAIRATTGAEILLMYGGPTPDAFAGLQSISGVRLEHLPGTGPVSLLNAAITHLAPHDVVRVDPGVNHLSAGWLDLIHASASAHATIGVTGIKLLA